MQKPLPLARLLLLTLLALVMGLSTVAALSLGRLYEARRQYEGDLSRTYQLQVAAANLLSAGTIEEAILRQSPGRDDERLALAQSAFTQAQESALVLANGDAESERLLRNRVDQQIAARRFTATGTTSETEVSNALSEAKRLTQELSARQEQRRAEARSEVRRETRRAIYIASISGCMAVLFAVALMSILVTRMRRPLSELVDAVRRFAGGDIQQRIQPSGPRELSDLGNSFNTIAGELESAQSRIENARRHLATTIERLGDALVTCEVDGTVTSVNPRSAELVPELVPGSNAYDDKTPLPSLEAALSGDASVVHHGHTLEVSCTPLALGMGDEGMLWTLRDVSERAKLEQSKSEFVATASQELRTPLNSIKGFAQLLSNTGELDIQQREFLEVIVTSTNRLTSIVNDLLDVAQIDAGKLDIRPVPTDIVNIAQEVVDQMRPQITMKKQQLEFVRDDNAPSAMADPDRIRQILTNLVNNASAYTDEGGRVHIRVDVYEGMIRVAVGDNGVGMTEEELAHIFDRFYRADHDRGTGAGLGLHVVKALVDLHAGLIDIKSSPGKGTMFSVRFPLAVPSETPVSPLSSPAATGRSGHGSASVTALQNQGATVLLAARAQAKILIEPMLDEFGIEYQWIMGLTELRQLPSRLNFDAAFIDSGLPNSRKLAEAIAARGTDETVTSIMLFEIDDEVTDLTDLTVQEIDLTDGANTPAGRD